MANHKLKKGNIEIEVAQKGAELVSYKKDGIEYMWDKNPEYWSGCSPLLFPFVGSLKDGKYKYKDKEYSVATRHGFVRTEEFELVENIGNKLVYKYVSNEETLKKYPFEFELYVSYILNEKDLEIKYEVVNKTNGEMYFSLGTHPAFKLDIDENIKLEDYYLELEKKENARKHKLTENGLLKNETESFLENENIINLNKNIFDEDAICFSELESEIVTLKNSKNSKQVSVKYSGFPYIAFWSKPNAPFVCIEPWYGITDLENTNGKIENKKGIVYLKKNGKFEAKLVITVDKEY